MADQDSAPANNGDLIVNGRRYLSAKAVGEIVGYGDRYIRWLANNRPGIRQERRGGRVFFCVSDVVGWQKNQQPTKWQRIAEWWRSHPGERAQITDTYDFHRRLLRDGVQCSPALARWFIAKYAPKCWPSHIVLEWLEQDPARRNLTGAQIRRAISAALHRRFNRKAVELALARYDARHGQPKPPFEPSFYMTKEEAAQRLGVKPGTIPFYVQAGRLIGHIWRHKLYVFKLSVACFDRGNQRGRNHE